MCRLVVNSIKDDPIRLREPRYIKSRRAPKGEVRAAAEPHIALVLNDDHTIHHVQERGYVEAPVRIRSILTELDASGLFEKVPAKRFSDRHIRAVHDGRLVDYIRKACFMAGPKKSIYPYVFPTRNPARAPKDETVLAGYYCIDTFTPLNQNAYLAARSAVDCALTAAERVLEGAGLAYALVRPPGHHAETHTFGGFCYFNNAAIAANLLARYGKVAILDIDYHHGNGQQEIFYARSDVLTVSIHGHPSFRLSLFHRVPRRDGDRPGRGLQSEPAAARARHARAAPPRGDGSVAPHPPLRARLSRGFARLRHGARRSHGHVVQPGARFRAARPHDRRAGLSNSRGAGGRLPRAHARQQCPQFFYRSRHRPFGGAAGGACACAQRRGAQGPTAQGGGLEWRSAVMADDLGRVRSLVASTGFFNAAEVEIAGELVQERLVKGIRSGYHFILAERGPALVAYACYGPIEGTQGSFDLYWIAVAPEEQGKGLGPQVFARAEAAMRKAGAKHIYVDTSTSDRYAGTRGFYQRMGFEEEARLPDFYGPGDGKVIYVKALAPSAPLPPRKDRGG